MEGVLQRVVAVLISVVIFFILPIYISYEKRDDISYALALKITTDFVEEVKSKGYISEEMYQDFVLDLATTSNSYDIYLEHTAKKYNPVIYSYTDDLKTIRAKFDFNLYKDQYESGQIVVSDGSNAGTYNNLILAYDLSEKRYTEDQILDVIGSTNKLVTTTTSLDAYKGIDYRSLPAISSIYELKNYSNNIYTMNEGDEFNVIVKNHNTTLATTLYNIVTFGAAANNTTKVYVNYGGTIKAETYRTKEIDEDTKNYNPDSDKHTADLVNSYVQSGLIAMYNGEFNAGTSHSNKADTWVDLSGNGNNAALSGFDFNDESGWIYNGVHLTGKEYIAIPELELDSDVTIEVVVKFDTINDVDNSEQTILSNSNYGGLGLTFNQLNCVDALKRGKFSFDIATQTPEGNLSDDASTVIDSNVVQANKVYSIAGSFGKVKLDADGSGMYYQTTAQLLSVNGVVDGKDFNTVYMPPAMGTTFVIGGTPLVGAGANTQLKGTIYSIRIYNRALTEEELKENFEIDNVKYKID